MSQEMNCSKRTIFIVAALLFLLFDSRLLASEVGLWGIKTPGVDQALAKVLIAELEKSIASVSGYRVIGSSQLRKRLEKAGVLPGASWETLFPALGLDWIVTGTITGIGGQLAADLRLVDGRKGNELRRVAMELEAELLASQMAELATRLLVPEKWIGHLLVETSVPGARVYVDEQQVGTTPLDKPIENLVPGKHILRVVKEGYADFSHFVTVKYNQLVRVKVNLENSTVEGMLYQDDKIPPAPVTTIVKPRLVVVRPSLLPAWLALGTALGAAAAGTALWFTDYQAPAVALLTASAVAIAGSTVALVIAWPHGEGSSRTDEKTSARPSGFFLVWSIAF